MEVVYLHLLIFWVTFERWPSLTVPRAGAAPPGGVRSWPSPALPGERWEGVGAPHLAGAAGDPAVAQHMFTWLGSHQFPSLPYNINILQELKYSKIVLMLPHGAISNEGGKEGGKSRGEPAEIRLFLLLKIELHCILLHRKPTQNVDLCCCFSAGVGWRRGGAG